MVNQAALSAAAAAQQQQLQQRLDAPGGGRGGGGVEGVGISVGNSRLTQLLSDAAANSGAIRSRSVAAAVRGNKRREEEEEDDEEYDYDEEDDEAAGRGGYSRLPPKRQRLGLPLLPHQTTGGPRQRSLSALATGAAAAMPAPGSRAAYLGMPGVGPPPGTRRPLSPSSPLQALPLPRGFGRDGGSGGQRKGGTLPVRRPRQGGRKRTAPRAYNSPGMQLGSGGSWSGYPGVGMPLRRSGSAGRLEGASAQMHGARGGGGGEGGRGQADNMDLDPAASMLLLLAQVCVRGYSLSSSLSRSSSSNSSSNSSSGSSRPGMHGRSGSSGRSGEAG